MILNILIWNNFRRSETLDLQKSSCVPLVQLSLSNPLHNHNGVIKAEN